METIAEGLATRTAFELPQSILRQGLADFLLVSDADIGEAQVLMMDKTRNLVEAAGATAFAGALKIRDALRGKQVAIICSGGNVSLDQLRNLLATRP
jgi:threonine dehydratase